MPDNSTQLLAVYDFAVAPTSFDFVNFMARAEQFRRDSGTSKMTVLFVLDKAGGFWNMEDRSTSRHRARAENLLIPLCALWHADVLEGGPVTRSAATEFILNWKGPTFPQNYDPDLPETDSFQWSHIVASHYTGKKIPLWQAGQNNSARFRPAGLQSPHPFALVTLRQGADGRRSNVESWAALAERLSSEGLRVGFVRDTDFLDAPAPESIQRFEVFDDASRNPQLRAALYQEADLNLMHANGPMQLCWLGAKTRSMVFGIANDAYAHGRAMPIRSMGLNIGKPLPNHDGRHRLVWQPDDADTLLGMTGEIITATADRTRIVEADPEELPIIVARHLRKAHRLESARAIYSYLAGNQNKDRFGGLAGQALTATADNRLSTLNRRYSFLRYFFQLASVKPKECSGESLAEIAEVYQRARRTSKAMRLAEASLKDETLSDSGRALAYFIMGNCHSRHNDTQAARTCWEQAAEADPHDSAALVALSDAALAAGNSTDACMWRKKAVLVDPSVRTPTGAA